VSSRWFVERKALVGCYCEKGNSFDNIVMNKPASNSTLYFQWPRKYELTDLDIMPSVCTVLAETYCYIVLYYIVLYYIILVYYISILYNILRNISLFPYLTLCYVVLLCYTLYYIKIFYYIISECDYLNLYCVLPYFITIYFITVYRIAF
jgi:hypothetical protein